MKPRRNSWFLAILALATGVLALNGLHYWHEVRFCYAVTRFSVDELLHGVFNPHQFGNDVDELASAGFYVTKVLHVASLKAIFSLVAPAHGGFELAMALSFVLLGSTAIVTRQIFQRAFGDQVLADWGVVAFLLSPVVPYMAGKLMAEVPALFFAALAILAGQRALTTEPGSILRWSIGSGLLTLLTVLSRFDLGILIFGFWAAILLTEAGFEQRVRVLRILGISGAIAAAGYLGVLLSLGADPRSFVQYLRDFTGAGVKSPLISLLGILTFGGWIYVVAVCALGTPRRKAMHFFLVWFVVSAGTMLVITSRYMVEPRYLIHGLIPFAGLGALGLETARKRSWIPPKFAIAMTLVVLITNWALIRLMPYEVNRPQILAAVQDIVREEPNAAILTPWAYTDFHFLKIMRPDVPIYNVNGDLPAENRDSLDTSWQRRSMDWYGDSFLNSPTRLHALLQERPVYYLGWNKYPPIENVSAWMQQLGLLHVSRRVAALPSRNHLAESWVWRSGRYTFEQKGRRGQYVVYRLRSSHDSPVARRSQAPAQPQVRHQ